MFGSTAEPYVPARRLPADLTRQIVDSVTAEYGQATREVLEEYMPAQEPWRYLYGPLADYPARGGKMLRPSLCIATARALGARTEQALRTAASIELLHNALLIHDDVEDGSVERRGQPTLHELHGIPIAINVGDSLSLMSMRPLIDNRLLLGPTAALQILEEAERMARETAEGQAMELGWRADNLFDVSEGDYLSMVLKKTCWLTTIFPIRVGALIAGVPREALDDFVRFGFFLGAAFQMQDDLLNLDGEADQYGKEICGDLWEGKRTIVLLHLYRSAEEEERRRILGTFAKEREERTEDDVAWMRERLDHYGSIEYARGVLHGVAGAAMYEFSKLEGWLQPSRDRDFIECLVAYVIERDR